MDADQSEEAHLEALRLLLVANLGHLRKSLGSLPEIGFADFERMLASKNIHTRTNPHTVSALYERFAEGAGPSGLCWLALERQLWVPIAEANASAVMDLITSFRSVGSRARSVEESSSAPSQLSRAASDVSFDSAFGVRACANAASEASAPAVSSEARAPAVSSDVGVLAEEDASICTPSPASIPSHSEATLLRQPEPKRPMLSKTALASRSDAALSGGVRPVKRTIVEPLRRASSFRVFLNTSSAHPDPTQTEPTQSDRAVTPLASLASTDVIPPPKRAYTVRKALEERAEQVYLFHFEGRSGRYQREGDARLMSEQASKERQRLMKSRRIWRACRQFWDALGLREDEKMHRRQYWRLHALITCVLAPGMSEEEAAEAAAEDWEADLRGEKEMTFELHLRSIFEVADLWTNSTNELDYVIFINKLFRRCTRPVDHRRKRPSQRGAQGKPGGENRHRKKLERWRSFDAVAESTGMQPQEGEMSGATPEGGNDERDDERDDDKRHVHVPRHVPWHVPRHCETIGASPASPPAATPIEREAPQPEPVRPSILELSAARDAWANNLRRAAHEQELTRRARALAFREAWRTRGGELSSGSESEEEGGETSQREQWEHTRSGGRGNCSMAEGQEESEGESGDETSSSRSFKSVNDMREEADAWATQHEAAMAEARARAKAIVEAREAAEAAAASASSPKASLVPNTSMAHGSAVTCLESPAGDITSMEIASLAMFDAEARGSDEHVGDGEHAGVHARLSVALDEAQAPAQEVHAEERRCGAPVDVVQTCEGAEQMGEPMNAAAPKSPEMDEALRPRWCSEDATPQEEAREAVVLLRNAKQTDISEAKKPSNYFEEPALEAQGMKERGEDQDMKGRGQCGSIVDVVQVCKAAEQMGEITETTMPTSSAVVEGLRPTWCSAESTPQEEARAEVVRARSATQADVTKAERPTKPSEETSLAEAEGGRPSRQVTPLQKWNGLGETASSPKRIGDDGEKCASSPTRMGDDGEHRAHLSEEELTVTEFARVQPDRLHKEVANGPPITPVSPDHEDTPLTAESVQVRSVTPGERAAVITADAPASISVEVREQDEARAIKATAAKKPIVPNATYEQSQQTLSTVEEAKARARAMVAAREEAEARARAMVAAREEAEARARAMVAARKEAEEVARARIQFSAVPKASSNDTDYLPRAPGQSTESGAASRSGSLLVNEGTQPLPKSVPVPQMLQPTQRLTACATMPLPAACRQPGRSNVDFLGYNEARPPMPYLHSTLPAPAKHQVKVESEQTRSFEPMRNLVVPGMARTNISHPGLCTQVSRGGAIAASGRASKKHAASTTPANNNFRSQPTISLANQVLDTLPHREPLHRVTQALADLACNMAQRSVALEPVPKRSVQNVVMEAPILPPRGHLRDPSLVLPAEVTRTHANVELISLPPQLEQQGWRRKRLGESAHPVSKTTGVWR